MKKNLTVRIRIEVISLWNDIVTIAVFADDRLSGVMAAPCIYLEGGENEWQES